MEILNKIQTYALLITLSILLTSCFSEDNFLTDNLELTDRSFPVITDIIILNSQDEYSEGDNIQFDIRFWSDDPVSEIILYDELVGLRGLEIAVQRPASEATFSEESQTDAITLVYVVPEITQDPTTINFVIEVVNENGLTEQNTSAKNPTIRSINVRAVP